MEFIRLNNEYVPVRISPQDLEGLGITRLNKRGEQKKCHYFKSNPLEVIKKLCGVYAVPFTIKRESDSKVKSVKLSIPALDIELIAYGRSGRKAMRRMAFKLHHEYCLKIISIRKYNQ